MEEISTTKISNEIVGENDENVKVNEKKEMDDRADKLTKGRYENMYNC